MVSLETNDYGSMFSCRDVGEGVTPQVSHSIEEGGGNIYRRRQWGKSQSPLEWHWGGRVAHGPMETTEKAASTGKMGQERRTRKNA